MPEALYQIVFHGELAPRYTREQAGKRLAILLKADDAKIGQLFAKVPCVLAKNLNMEKAGQYQAAFHKAGIVCRINPMRATAPVKAAPPPAPAPVAAPEPAPRPPKEAEPLPAEQKTNRLDALERTLAILVIAVMLSGAALRIWAANQLSALDGPTHLHQTADGTVYVLSNGTFYLHDAYGRPVREIPLSRFGIEGYIGDFAVFQNGDLLLRRQTQDNAGLLKKLSIFNRDSADEQDMLPPGQSVLQRCQAETGQCQAFGKDGEVFGSTRTFKLLLDEAGGRLFIADTANQQLLLLDLEGRILARSGKEFEFPNQLALGQDGLLYVADTNHFRIAGVEPGQENFGTVRKSFVVLALEQALSGRIWPMALGQTPAGEWWVINADGAMRDGYLMRYQADGKPIGQIKLPDKADPLALLVTETGALVADATLMRVYSVTSQGALESDFGSPAFTQNLKGLQSQQRLYSTLKSSALWLLVLALGVAFWVQRRHKQRIAEETYA